MIVALLSTCESPLHPNKALLSLKKLGPCARTRTRTAQVVQKASLSLTPRGANMIPRLSPPPYRDSPSPIAGPSRSLEQPQYALEQPQPPPLHLNLQQQFVLHFTMPHATIIWPGHSLTQRYAIQMEREDTSIPPPPVHRFTQTCMCLLPHLLEEEVNCLPRQAASLPPPFRLPCWVQYHPQTSPLHHAQIMAWRAKMRELTTLMRELNDTLEDAGLSNGIDWEKATIGIIISLSQT